MTQPTRLDITGVRTNELRLPLPQDTKDALAKKGIEAPDEVTLYLQEATGRELQRFEQAQAPGGPAQRDTAAFIVDLMMRRAAPGTDVRVLQELVHDMTPTAIAQVTHAYCRGVLPDPKALMAAMTRLTSQTETLLLMQLASGTLHSSPTSTASDPGSDTASGPPS